MEELAKLHQEDCASADRASLSHSSFIDKNFSEVEGAVRLYEKDSEAGIRNLRRRLREEDEESLRAHRRKLVSDATSRNRLKELYSSDDEDPTLRAHRMKLMADAANSRYRLMQYQDKSSSDSSLATENCVRAHNMKVMVDKGSSDGLIQLQSIFGIPVA